MRNQHVARLDVTMDNVILMKSLQTIEQVHGIANHLFFVNGRVVLDAVPQCVFSQLKKNQY